MKFGTHIRMDPIHIVLSYHNVHMHTCAKLLGGFLLPLWKGAGSAPYRFLCTFSSARSYKYGKCNTVGQQLVDQDSVIKQVMC